MMHNYVYTLFEYKTKSGSLMKDYLKLKEKNEHLDLLKIELRTRIERLSVSLMNKTQQL